MITKLSEDLNTIPHINDIYNKQANKSLKLTPEKALAILIAAAPAIHNLPKAPYYEAAGKKCR